MLLVALGVAIAVIVASLQDGLTPVTLPVIVALFALMLTFTQLNTKVDDTHLEASFRFGWPRKHIPLREIAGARPATFPWYYGYGIRYTFKGWLYRVAGRRGVDIVRRNAPPFRIGTDDPEGLLRALRQHGIPQLLPDP
jgi:hypothetical protein